MDRFTFINLALCQGQPLEGLEIVSAPDNDTKPDSRIVAAWQLGHGTEYGERGIVPGRDWFAVVWRDAGGNLRSFGRWRHHREFLGVEDDKVFYAAKSRVSGRRSTLSRGWPDGYRAIGASRCTGCMNSAAMTRWWIGYARSTASWSGSERTGDRRSNSSGDRPRCRRALGPRA
jgi:hypothetical protein